MEGSVDGLLVMTQTTGSCLVAWGLSLSAIAQNEGKGGLRLAFSLSSVFFEGGIFLNGYCELLPLFIVYVFC